MKSKAEDGVKNCIDNIVNFFKELPSKIWEWLVQVVLNILRWILEMKQKAEEGVKNTVDSIINFFKELPSKLVDIGKNLIKGLWEGISDAASWLWGKISGFCNDIINKIKDFFGIHSPSRVFNKEVGKYLALGLGEGFSDNLDSVYKDMKSAVDFETQKLSTNLSATAVLNADKDNAKTTNNDNSTVINNTQNFYEKQATPYEEQKQAKQQLRRLAYGL